MSVNELQKVLLERLSQLADWHLTTLVESEARHERDIERGLQAIANNAAKSGFTGDEVLSVWETMFLEESIAISDDPALMGSSLGLSMTPPLEVGEYALLVGLYLARAGVGYVVSGSAKQSLLAALMLADAVEAQCYWIANRGLTGCRKPHPDAVTAEKMLKRRESASLIRDEKSEAARKAANAKHGKPGGSRDKADQIRAIWASGKYSTREICAEQECGALDMSFSTARRALRGTPEPMRKPSK
ncbi:hypothetical protein AWB71_00925 [Caballeronia peredens]|nr:hypothetical protein AWB71_00925 [Caballeronia peredens]